MTTIRVGDRELVFERQARRGSESIYEIVLFVESASGDVSIRSQEMDVDGRGDITASAVESALQRWQDDHQDLDVERFVVRETQRCGAGRSTGESEATRDGERATGRSDGSAARGRTAGSYGVTNVGFVDVPVDPGEEVEFQPSGSSAGVYGTRTGTVTDVKTGTGDAHVLVVETDSGTNRVREDWLVESEIDGSGTDDSVTDESEADDSVTDESEADDSVTDESGTDESEADDSATDDSATDDSETDDE